MNILIIGCGRVGSRLAVRLSHSGHQVVIIDEAREAFLRLTPDFPGHTFPGSGLDIEVLRRAGAESADVVFALTGGDNRNLMIAQLLKQRFKVERSVARLHDPVRAAKYRELGIETMCTTTILEGLLEIYVQRGEFPELPGEMSVYGDASALEDN
ncbi:MAG TPA: TrkA family potassium uptake protein [Abditibacteriaceae bacterium]|nr:TrkA family potassium uptake protein [Abditibacteriaceae bacterium]